jgi:hypothetical protein
MLLALWPSFIQRESRVVPHSRQIFSPRRVIPVRVPVVDPLRDDDALLIAVLL